MTLAKVRKIFSSDLVKVFSFTSLATLVRMLTGLVSVKVVALLVGPAGMAVMGQLTSIVGISQSVSTGGIGGGVTSFVSSERDNEGMLRSYLSAALRITLLCTLLLSLFFIAGARWVAANVLMCAEYAWVVRVFGVTLILYSLNSLLLSIINGFKEFRDFVKISIWNSVVGMLFTVAMVYVWGLPGAMLAAVTFQSVVFFVTLWMVRRSGWLYRANFMAPWSRIAGRGYLKYAVMAAVTLCCGQVTQLILRSYVMVDISGAAAGLWEGINKLSGVWMSVVTTAFGVWYLPRFAELKEMDAVKREMRQGYRLFVPLFALAFLVVFLLRRPLIMLLFSREFIPMQELFGWQLGADMIKICAWIIGYWVVAKGMMRTFVVLELISAAVYLGCGSWLMKLHGIAGLCQAALVEQSVYFILVACVFAYCCRRERVSAAAGRVAAEEDRGEEQNI